MPNLIGGRYLSEQHQGFVRLVSDFDKAWEFLNTSGEVTLETEKNAVQFIAEASVPIKGKHAGKRAIRFLHYYTRKVSAYVFECCWGHHTNCYGDGTRIGMYCEALDRLVRSS